MASTNQPADDSFPTPKKNWRRVLLIIFFVLLNVVVITFAGISEFGNSSSASKLVDVNVNGWFLVPAVVCFVVAFCFEILKYVIMMRRLAPKNNKKRPDYYKVARRVVLLGRYYDNITPAAIGGQPFQMYYMRKHSGLSAGASTAIPIFGMISLQISFIIIAIICFVFGGVLHDHPALVVTAWIGLVFYAFWPIMVMGVSFFPKPTTAFIKWIIKILAKLHIVKNREKILARVEDEMAEYAKSVKMILKTKGLFVLTIGLSLLFNILTGAIPFFVLTAFGGNVDFWSCFATTIAVMSAVYFVPTPGNSGAAEGTFFLVFSALSSGYVFWAMLTWRFFSYYIYILMGPVIYFFMHLEKKHGKI